MPIIKELKDSTKLRQLVTNLTVAQIHDYLEEQSGPDRKTKFCSYDESSCPVAYLLNDKLNVDIGEDIIHVHHLDVDLVNYHRLNTLVDNIEFPKPVSNWVRRFDNFFGSNKVLDAAQILHAPIWEED